MTWPIAISFIIGLIAGIRFWMWLTDSMEAELKRVYSLKQRQLQAAYKWAILIYNQDNGTNVSVEDIEVLRDKIINQVETEVLIDIALSNEKT